MSREKIAIDIDDVLADSTDALRQFVNMRRGVDLSEEHYRVEAAYWQYYEGVWQQHEIDSTDLMDEFHDGMAKSQTDIRPIPGSVEGCIKLSKKFDLGNITSRPEIMQTETGVWFAEHFPPVFEERIFLDFGENAKKPKGEVCLEKGYKYLVDDNVDHCKDAIARGVTAILFGRMGWHVEVPEDMIRCQTWPDLEEYFGV